MSVWKNDIFSISLVSTYLFVYCVLIQFESTEIYAVLMWMLAPFLIVWMVYTVIRYGKYEGPELGEKEYGYFK